MGLSQLRGARTRAGDAGGTWGGGSSLLPISPGPGPKCWSCPCCPIGHPTAPGDTGSPLCYDGHRKDSSAEPKAGRKAESQMGENVQLCAEQGGSSCQCHHHWGTNRYRKPPACPQRHALVLQTLSQSFSIPQPSGTQSIACYETVSMAPVQFGGEWGALEQPPCFSPVTPRPGVRHLQTALSPTAPACPHPSPAVTATRGTECPRHQGRDWTHLGGGLWRGGSSFLPPEPQRLCRSSGSLLMPQHLTAVFNIRW